MPLGSTIEIIPATSFEVFDLLHDYDRRLQWDTLLKNAYLSNGFTEAKLHATSVCTGRWYLGSIEVETEYISFNPPHIAAVKMVNRPPFFESFAATIKHCDREDGTSTIEYKYNFTARPSSCRWILHPAMNSIFH